MNCKKAEKLLIDYLYQELSAKKIVEVEKHLSVCDACSKTVESWRAIHQGFHRTAEDEASASPYLKQKLLIAAREELERKQTLRERFQLLLKPALLLPLLIFAIATVLYLPLQSNKPQMEARKIAPSPFAPARAQVSKNEESKTQPKMLDYRSTEAGKEADALQAYRDKEANLSLKQKVAPLTEAEKKSEGDYDEAAKSRQRDLPAGTPSPGRADSGMTANSSALQEPSASPAAPAPPSAMGEVTPRPEAQEEQKAASAPPPQQAEVVSKLSKDSGGSSEVYFQQAQSRFQQDDLKGGVTIAQEAVKRDDSRALAVQFHQSGIQYQQNRDCEKAIPQFTMILNNYRDYSGIENVLLRLGDCYAEIGQVEAAKRVFTRLLQFPASHDVAAQKIQQINKKIQSQQDLKALGYVNQ